MGKPVVAVAAVVQSQQGLGIGVGGKLPWKSLPTDMAHFRRLTQTPGAAVVMGRKTWESIPARFRPLEGRINVVVSREPERLALPPGVLAAYTLEAALETLQGLEACQAIFVIGGAQVYAEAFGKQLCDRMVLTHVEGPEVECDAFLVTGFSWVCDHPGEPIRDEKTGYIVRFCEYRRLN